jgi:hypothetical protein
VIIQLESGVKDTIFKKTFFNFYNKLIINSIDTILFINMKIQFLKNVAVDVAVVDGFTSFKSFKANDVIEVEDVIKESKNFSILRLSSTELAMDVRNDVFKLIS